MLSSITPLGERGRKQRYWLTATAFVTASVVGGSAFGLLCGLLGGLLPGGHLYLALAGALAALVVDATSFTLPSTKRQVNEDWLPRWRGWVYGLGFGLQLGFGLATVVPAALGYLLWLLAFATASPSAGLMIGALFGLGRGLALLAGRGVRSIGDLVAFHRRLASWGAHGQRTAIGADALAAGLVVVQLLR